MIEKTLLTLPFDAIACVSETTYRSVPTKLSHNTHLITNGMDEHDWDPRHISSESASTFLKERGISDKKFFLYFGRYGKTKGLDLLLKTAYQWLAKHRDFALLVLIPAHDIHRFRSYHHRCSRIVLYPHVSHEMLKELILWSHAVVIPSLTE